MTVAFDLLFVAIVIVESFSSSIPAGVDTVLHGEVDIPFVLSEIPLPGCADGDRLRFLFDLTEVDLCLPLELCKIGSNPGYSVLVPDQSSPRVGVSSHDIFPDCPDAERRLSVEHCLPARSKTG